MSPLPPLAMPLITDPGASVSYIGIYVYIYIYIYIYVVGYMINQWVYKPS